MVNNERGIIIIVGECGVGLAACTATTESTAVDTITSAMHTLSLTCRDTSESLRELSESLKYTVVITDIERKKDITSGWFNPKKIGMPARGKNKVYSKPRNQLNKYKAHRINEVSLN